MPTKIDLPIGTVAETVAHICGRSGPYRRYRDFLISQLAEEQRAAAIERRHGRGKCPENVNEEDWGARAASATDDELAQITRPFRVAARYFRVLRSREEKQLRAFAEQLPVYGSFVEPLPGFGSLGLAQIIGETGDLSSYANPGKLWKRMGLAPYNGQAASQWRRKGGLSADEWTTLGYVPRRRSTIFVVTNWIITRPNEYRELYLARKAMEQTKAPDLSKDAWHKRAHRYVAKRLLRNLWRAWRDPGVNDIRLADVDSRTPDSVYDEREDANLWLPSNKPVPSPVSSPIAALA